MVTKMLTAEEERTILRKLWSSKSPDEEVFEILTARDRRTRRLRSKLVIDLTHLEDDEIEDRERLKEALLAIMKDDHEIVRRKAAITCAFLDITETVTIVLNQLEDANHKTAVPFLKALSVFQDESSRDSLNAYAAGLSEDEGWIAHILLLYVAQVLGFLDVSKARGSKLDPQYVWDCLR